MEKFIALASYCKGKNLSIPSDFKIEELLEHVPKDKIKISGYKFSESYLEKVVPRLGFQPIKKSKPIHQRLALYTVDKDYIFTIEKKENETILAYAKQFGNDFAKNIETVATTEFTIDSDKIKEQEDIIKSFKLLSNVIIGFDVFEALFGKNSNTTIHLIEKEDKVEHYTKLKELAISIMSETLWTTSNVYKLKLSKKNT
jgi:hypothetical protein